MNEALEQMLWEIEALSMAREADVHYDVIIVDVDGYMGVAEGEE